MSGSIGEAGVRKVPFNMSDPSVGSSIPLSLSGIQEDGKELLLLGQVGGFLRG